jgi:Raf kinase inhibitor-like YbhB/YbcL family protein
VAVVAAVFAMSVLTGCSGERQPTGMSLTSPAFAHKGPIPERFSCEGDNLPPPLRWSAPPPGTTEQALVVQDADDAAGIFVHWLVVGIDPSVTGIEPEVMPPGGRVLPGSSDNDTYIGPCPPDGSGRHRYFFQVYALPRPLQLAEDSAPNEKVRAIRRAATKGGTLIGTFTR